jgi:hypothetical protein
MSADLDEIARCYGTAPPKKETARASDHAGAEVGASPIAKRLISVGFLDAEKSGQRLIVRTTKLGLQAVCDCLANQPS